MDATKNFARSLVATAPSPANSGTSLVVTAGEGSVFPAVPFNAVIAPANALPLSNNSEIVRVTARSTDTLTITRSQEASSARTIAVGDQLFVGVTAKVLTDLDAGSTGGFSVNGQLTTTTMQIGGDGGVWSRVTTGITEYRGNLSLIAPGYNSFSYSAGAPDNPGGPYAAWMMRGSGKMEWSNGDQIFDVSLYRPSARWLQIDGSLQIVPTVNYQPSLVVKAAASQSANIQEWQNSAGAVLAYVRNDGSIYTPNVLGASNFDIRGVGDVYVSTGDPAGTVNLRNFNGPVSLSVLPNTHVALWNGILEFGPFPTSDTLLQRQSANNLATPGSFWVGNSFILDVNNTGAKVYWGSALDTALYRSAPFTLKANASLLVDGAVYVNSARNANPAFRIYDMGAGGGSVMDTYCEFIWPTRAVYHFSDQANAVFHELFIRGRGTIAAPLGLQAGDYLALYGWRGYYGPNQTDNLNHASIYVQATETWTATAQGATLTFYTTPAGQSGQVASMILNGNNTYTPLLQTDRLMNLGSIPSVPTAIVRAPAAMTSNIQEWQSSTGVILSRLNKDGYYVVKQNAAIADADLLASEMVTWFDPTNGAAKFMVKGKQADGTVVSGTVWPSTGGSSPNTDWINVRNAPYSAAGDNTANDTTAIQSALTAAGSGPKTVYIPQGAYKITAALNVPAGVSIVGAGIGTILHFCGCDGLVFAASPWLGSTKIEKFYIRGRNAANTGAPTSGDFAGVRVIGDGVTPGNGGQVVYGVEFDSLTFEGWGWAFRLRTLFRSTIMRCNGSGLYNGIELKGQCLVMDIHDNFLQRGSAPPAPTGYTESVGFRTEASNDWTDTLYHDSESVFVHDNQFYGFDVGAYNVHGLHVYYNGNDFDGVTKCGIRYQQSEHTLVIKDNWIAGMTATFQYGIQAESPGGGVSKGPVEISGNDINAFTPFPATAYGVYLAADQHHTHIHDNYFNGFVTNDISASGTNTGLLIENNACTSTTPTYSIAVGSGCTGTIRHNLIVKTISINPASPMILHDQRGAGADAAAQGWRTIGGAGHPAFANSWTNQNVATYGSARFRLEPGGMVAIEGKLTGTTANTTSFVLPAGFKPPNERGFPTYANGVFAMIDIEANGNVWMKSAQVTQYTLSGIRFANA